MDDWDEGPRLQPLRDAGPSTIAIIEIAITERTAQPVDKLIVDQYI